MRHYFVSLLLLLVSASKNSSENFTSLFQHVELAEDGTFQGPNSTEVIPPRRWKNSFQVNQVFTAS